MTTLPHLTVHLVLVGYFCTWEKSVPRGADAPFRTSVSGSEGCPLFPAQMPSGNSQPASLKKNLTNFISESQDPKWNDLPVSGPDTETKEREKMEGNFLQLYKTRRYRNVEPGT